MASHRKPLYILKHNERHCKLSKNMKKVTCESSPFTLPGGKSPEVPPCSSRKLRTKYLLRFYCSVKANKKTARKSTPMAADGEISQPAKIITSSKATSSDYFEFPSDVKSTDEKVMLSQTKQEVLRTIKRMTEENKVLRARLLALSQRRQSS